MTKKGKEYNQNQKESANEPLASEKQGGSELKSLEVRKIQGKEARKDKSSVEHQIKAIANLARKLEIENLKILPVETDESLILNNLYRDSQISPKKQLLKELQRLNCSVNSINHLLNLYPELDTKPCIKAVKGKLQRVYSDIGEAVKDGFVELNVKRCLSGVNKTHCGFTWTNEYISAQEFDKIKNSK